MLEISGFCHWKEKKKIFQMVMILFEFDADLVNRNFRKFRGVIPSSHFAIRLSHFSVWLFPILTNSIPVKNSFRFGKEAEKTQKIPEKT